MFDKLENNSDNKERNISDCQMFENEANEGSTTSADGGRDIFAKNIQINFLKN